MAQHRKRKMDEDTRTTISASITQSKSSSNMSNKIYSTIFSDCTIKANGVEIGVHKRTLAARIEVVEEMLSYVYRNEVPNIENIASKVLAIADKYELNELKRISENILCSSLAIENVCQRFALSEKFETEILKEHCQDIIIQNAELIIKNDSYKKIILVNPLLLHSLFIKSLNISPTYSGSEE